MAAPPEKSMFTQTARLQQAVALVNRVAPERLPLILTRIAKKLHLKDDPPFTEAETKQLQVVLSFSGLEVSLLLESLAFILEQAAYFLATGATLAAQLTKLQVSATAIAIFQKVWDNERETLVGLLRDRSLAPRSLEETNWQLHLHMGQNDLARIKSPTALFELKLKSTEPVPDAPSDSIRLEFTHEELYKFYNQLELIQEQLDSLG